VGNGAEAMRWQEAATQQEELKLLGAPTFEVKRSFGILTPKFARRAGGR